MRLWQLVFAVAVLSFAMTLVREPSGRVFVIVFVTGLGEIAMGLGSLLALFETVGALGEAKGLYDHAEAVAATALVLAVGAALMAAWLFAGAWLVWVFV